VKRLFYVGRHPAEMSHGWAKNTLPEAIAHAKALAESTGKEQTIVQIIRVVRKPTRVVVENV
jgi:hypothetical protein